MVGGVLFVSLHEVLCVFVLLCIVRCCVGVVFVSLCKMLCCVLCLSPFRGLVLCVCHFEALAARMQVCTNSQMFASPKIPDCLLSPTMSREKDDNTDQT